MKLGLGQTLVHNRMVSSSVSDPEPFIMTIDTTQAGSASDTFVIPTLSSATYDYDVDWGDGSTDTITAWNQAERTHVYASSGTYQIKIYRIFNRMYFNNAGDKAKLMSIDQWGIIPWADMYKAFYGCYNMQGAWTDTPDLSNATRTDIMFTACFAFDHGS